jgi:hypothetical protein
MTPEEEKEWESTLFRSGYLPYPMNYMRYYHPGLAYLTVKIFDRILDQTTR